MLIPVKEKWNIVLAGKWNINIFSPMWVTDNIILSDTVDLEFSPQPGAPFKIICVGERIVLMPADNRMTIAPLELNEPTLRNLEKIACEILEKLPHTPMGQIGINFGYKSDNIEEDIIKKLDNQLVDYFADNDLDTKKRTLTWNCGFEDRILNLTCHLNNGDINFDFNFHCDIKNAKEAIGKIENKVLNYKNKSEEFLEKIFKLKQEE